MTTSTSSVTNSSTNGTLSLSKCSATDAKYHKSSTENDIAAEPRSKYSVAKNQDIELIEKAYGYVCVLECSDGSYYTGRTKNLEKRLIEHRNGEGAKHTKNRLPVKLVYYETYDRIDVAFYREKQIQGWSRQKKEALINNDIELIKSLSKSKTIQQGSERFDKLSERPVEPVSEPVELNFGQYPRDFFDFIIIDECHRGDASDESSWRAIMEYFSPAVQLGLTATPKRDVNKDTYEYFGKPVYIYSLKEGINDGFLTPFKVKEISTTGDTYVYTDDDTVLEGKIEEGREYTQEEQNRIIELMDIERYRVQTFMELINQNQKTLVFCVTQAHAAAIRDLINQYAKIQIIATE